MRTTRRRLGTVTAGLALALTLASCAGQIGDSADSAGGAGNAGGKTLALIPGVQSEPFYISLQCGAESEARKLGYKLTTKAPPEFDAPQQTEIVTGLGANKPDALLIAPTDDVAMTQPIKQIKNMGTKIVEVDTALRDRSVATSTISSDNAEGGRLAARTMAKLLGERRGSVLVLDTIAGTSTTNARAKGFEQEAAKHPNLTTVRIEFTQNEPEQSAAKVTAALSANPDLAGIFATNLNTGEGAATGLRNANKAGDITLIGFDASPSEVDGLRQGSFQALIAQDPASIGKQGVRQAAAAIAGKPAKRDISADLIAITRQNMSAKKEYFYKTQC